MEHHTLLLFTIACLSINLIPGPDVIYIVSNTMKGKMAAGMKAALGLGVGYVVHTLAACLGLSALILSSALAFSVVKWLGAAYLIYVGVKSLLAMWKGGSQLNVDTHSQAPQNIFMQGMIVSVLNPKVALFFLSFLPQFIDLAAGSASLQLFTFGLVFSLLATLCNVLYATAGSWLLSSPKASRYSRTLEGVSGVLLIGLAGKIAVSDR